MNTILISTVIAFLSLFAYVKSASAQNPICPTGSGDGIDTAIGCIPVSTPEAFIEFVLGWSVGVAGGFAFILIVFAGFQVSTSSGNPEKLQAGRELLTSAISGLVMLIFSVFILRLLGVDILGLPGLG